MASEEHEPVVRIKSNQIKSNLLKAEGPGGH